MEIIIVRGPEGTRTSDRLSRIAKARWGTRTKWWVEHYDGFSLVSNRSYRVRRELSYDVLRFEEEDPAGRTGQAGHTVVD